MADLPTEQEAAELIAEARAEARAAVKARLRESFERAMLERAETLLAGGGEAAPVPGEEPAVAAPPVTTGPGAAPAKRTPPAAAPEPVESGDGLWVYCVVPAGRELPDGLEGVAPGAPPQLVSGGELAALVSRVPLSEFGEQALRENLNDLGWLERMARTHEAVLERVLAGGEVVPLRVCTIYRGETQVRVMLEQRSQRLREGLERLAGKAEWGVKVIADRAALEEHARGRSAAARTLAEELDGLPEGGAYIVRKKLATAVRDEAERLVAEAVREGHARLEEWASASVVLPAQNRDLSGHHGEMVFNGAYLVDDSRVHPFVTLIRDLEAQYGDAGLSFDLTGPWPAYNFVRGLSESAEALL
jgi:hypothetical protein